MENFASKHWLVYRQDDNSNKILIRGKFDLTEQSADDVILEFTARGHKQTYFKLSYAGGELDKVLMENKIAVE